MRGRHCTDWAILVAPAIYLATPYDFAYNLFFLSAVRVFWLQTQGDRQLRSIDTGIWLALWYIPVMKGALYANGVPLIPILMVVAFLRQCLIAARESRVSRTGRIWQISSSIFLKSG
jgi:hypothetical protein